MPLTTAVYFDGWTLRPESGELSRAGTTTRLAQQPLRILIELLDHPGEVVRRERLVELLWPKGVVDFDGSLNAAVRKLRTALGDDSETPRYIETLPRIGYRLRPDQRNGSRPSRARSRNFSRPTRGHGPRDR